MPAKRVEWRPRTDNDSLDDSNFLSSPGHLTPFEIQISFLRAYVRRSSGYLAVMRWTNLIISSFIAPFIPEESHVVPTMS